MTLDKLTLPSKQNAVQNKINEIIDAIPTVPTNVSAFTNDAGYTTNTGTVTSVNNVQPDGSGNVTLSIPDAQIQSDWTQTTTTAKDYIKNKPSLATVATSGSYNDLSNKPTIPDAQVQSNWNETNTSSKAYIQNKPTIPTVPTNVSAFTNDAGYTTNTGTITGITMNGASKGTSGVVDLGTVITSHQDISGKEDKLKTVNALGTSGDINLSDNSINSITPQGNVNFKLPTGLDNTKFHQILVQINFSSNVYLVDLDTNYFFNKTAPDMSSTGVYNLIYEYDKANSYWVVGCIAKGASS